MTDAKTEIQEIQSKLSVDKSISLISSSFFLSGVQLCCNTTQHIKDSAQRLYIASNFKTIWL